MHGPAPLGSGTVRPQAARNDRESAVKSDRIEAVLPVNRLIELLTRGAVTCRIQRMSSAATKCQVGRRMCVRRNEPRRTRLGRQRRSTRGSHAKGPERMGVLLRLDAPEQADNVGAAGRALPVRRWVARRRRSTSDRMLDEPIDAGAERPYLAPEVRSTPNSNSRRVFAVSGPSELCLVDSPGRFHPDARMPPVCLRS